jgi:serine/threonine-protein kinase
MSGHIQVHCQRTLIKRCLHEVLGFVDQHPVAIIIGTTAVMSLFLAVLVQTVLKLIG